MSRNVAPIKSSTQVFLEIEDIKDGIVILKDGSCVLVIATTATNFGLLSEKEQDAVIYAYGALLNSLTFSIQILIRSKKKDITAYLNLLEEQERKITKQELRDQLKKYKEFVSTIVQVNNVLEKKFYLVIPMSFLETGLGKAVGSKTKKTDKFSYSKDFVLNKAKINLYPKRDHLFRLLNRLGLKSHQLDTQELVKLFFDIYNPDIHGQILSKTEDYQTPMVKPATNFWEKAPEPEKMVSSTINETIAQPEPKEDGPQAEIDRLIK